MFKSLDIQKDMEVVGLDGKHVGTVDHLETADRIILSKDDPKAGGGHLISIDWIDYVDQKVHLNKPSTKATSGMADGCLNLVFPGQPAPGPPAALSTFNEPHRDAHQETRQERHRRT